MPILSEAESVNIMRLGVVGICGDFRKLKRDEIAAVQELQFIGVSSHFANSGIPLVTPEE